MKLLLALIIKMLRRSPQPVHVKCATCDGSGRCGKTGT
jgi:hypothetical protein